MSTKKDDSAKPLQSAPPPWHSVALVGFLIAVFSAMLPSLEAIDYDATVETFTNRKFPDYISLQVLGWIRCAFAFLAFSTSYWTSCIDTVGWEQITTYLPKSKLKRNVVMRMKGFRTQLHFTSWAWNLLGISFALNSAIALMVAYGMGDKLNPWLLRAALLIFEVAAPNALLVACVIRYAIWPRILSSGGSTTQLRHWRTLLWHNANVIMALAEVSLLGGLPVRFSHFAVAPLFGIVYILFTWYMTPHWVEEGPQFIYFFFDTTLGYTTTIALVILLLVLMTFYGLFVVGDQLLDHLGGGPIVHALAVVLVSSLVCRFRD